LLVSGGTGVLRGGSHGRHPPLVRQRVAVRSTPRLRPGMRRWFAACQDGHD
jgi:hypothetical protein